MAIMSRMNVVIAIVFAVCFDAVLAQSTGPSECAQYCYGESSNLNVKFNCKLTDFECNCRTNTFVTEFATCLEGRCTADEISSDFALMVQQCNAFGVVITLPGVNSALVTATPIAKTFTTEFAAATASASLASVYGDLTGNGVPTDPGFVYQTPYVKAKPVNAGEISGIVVGIVVFIALMAGGFFLLLRKFKRKHREGTLPPILSPLASPTSEMYSSTNPFAHSFYSDNSGMYSPTGTLPQSPMTFGAVYDPTHGAPPMPEVKSPILQSPLLTQLPQNGLSRPPTIYRPPLIPYNPQDYVPKSEPPSNPSNGSHGLKITTEIPSSSLATDEKPGVDDIERIGTASYYGEEKKKDGP